jgi:AcrR family transcriptional regulator
VASSQIRPTRRERERELVDATKALFDERGLQDAPIEEIAKAVGINKALIYRHFSSKEELFVLTMTRYLDELRARLENVQDDQLDPLAQLRVTSEAYADFCLEYPAFLDCALSLMRRRARDLYESVSDAVWFRLGLGMAGCLGTLSRNLAAGVRDGVFAIDDVDFTANHLYTQLLGTMHLARVGVGVREAAPGIPETFRVGREQVRAACVEDALAIATRRGPTAPEAG